MAGLSRKSPPNRGTDAPRKRLSAPERREAIMAAAMELLAERGYHGASLGEIAEASGISKPVIYDHFRSKQELHVSLLNRNREELMGHVAASIAEEETAEEQLRRSVEAFFEFAERHPFAWRLLFRETTGEPAIVEAQRRNQALATAGIAALIAQEPAVQTLGLTEREIEMTAEFLKTGAHGLALWWYDHREVTREQLVAVFMDVAWIGTQRLLEGKRWRPPRS